MLPTRWLSRTCEKEEQGKAMMALAGGTRHEGLYYIMGEAVQDQ